VPVRVALDAFAIVVAMIAALVLRFAMGWFAVREASALTVPAHATACVVWLVGLLAALAFNRLYDEDTLFPGGGEQARLVRALVETAAMLSAFVFLTQSFYVSRSWFALTVALSAIALTAERGAMRAFLQRERADGRRRRPAILVSAAGDRWGGSCLDDVEEFDVVECLDPDAFEAFCTKLADGEPSAIEAVRGAAVVMRARDFTSDRFWRILLLAGQMGWSTFVHSPVRSVGRDRLTLRELGGHTIVKVSPPTLTGLRAAQKRALDVVIAGALLVVLSPLFPAIALLIALSSGRPVLFRQERVGLGGRPFTILKFRTMRPDAEAESGPVWAAPDDFRRTPVGRWLRRTSLDELPQLWNVLRGDMSLVGPRPERPGFAGGFSRQLPWYAFRHRIRPGMTGWAQANGLRGNTSVDARVDYDNWYVENWSVPLDLKILLRTSLQVVRGNNAY
jgi:exopolysaccharide biosynthesis polyprenyl glycosylphosphotransferase